MRRSALALAATLALTACATQAPPGEEEPPRGSVRYGEELRSTGVWGFDYDAGPGIATAVLAGAGGMQVRVSCQAPAGDLLVTDWTFSTTKPGGLAATLYVGGASTQSVAQAGDVEGRRAVTMRVSPLDPVFRSITPNADVRLAADGRVHRWADGAAQHVNDVINACYRTK